MVLFFFFKAEDGIRIMGVTGVQTCALPIGGGGGGGIGGHGRLRESARRRRGGPAWSGVRPRSTGRGGRNTLFTTPRPRGCRPPPAGGVIPAGPPPVRRAPGGGQPGTPGGARGPAAGRRSPLSRPGA